MRQCYYWMLFSIAFVVVILLFFFNKRCVSFMNSTSNYHIVVARYNEDTSWIPEKYLANTKVYNKGEGGDLPNIGRESHTYLTYIVENYDNLPDVVFFTQGGGPAHIDGKPIEYFTDIQESVSDNFMVSDIKNGLEENLHRPSYGNETLYPEKLDFKSWMKEHIGVELQNELTFYKGACFSVKKERILARPLEFYKKLLALIPEHKNPEVGHYFERAWWYIFK